MLWQLLNDTSDTGGACNGSDCDNGGAACMSFAHLSAFVWPTPADLSEKTASIFLENSAYASKKAKKISCATRRLAAQARRAKKVSFQLGGVRFCDCDFFFENKPVGTSFHVILMKVHTRTGPVAVSGLEKMLHTVPWVLGEISLYA